MFKARRHEDIGTLLKNKILKIRSNNSIIKLNYVKIKITLNQRNCTSLRTPPSYWNNYFDRFFYEHFARPVYLSNFLFIKPKPVLYIFFFFWYIYIYTRYTLSTVRSFVITFRLLWDPTGVIYKIN